jgi:hypothetical protein
MQDLIELFQSIEPIATSDSENRFSTILIPGYEPHRLGKDAQGRPLLLISILNVRSQNQRTPIVLEHLRVQYNLNCRVSRPDGTFEEGVFTVVHCTGEDVTLQNYFLKVMSTIVVSLGDRPTQSDVAHAINQLIELFRAMTKMPRKSVQGLWAELFLISQARQPAILVDAWHTVVEDRYDFAMDDQRIEVKSFSGNVRLHHFSLEQLHPPGGVKALVASVSVESSQAGISIADLRGKIQTRLGNNLDSLLHVDKIIALTLGDAWQQVSDARFDEKLAEESLAFYETSVIPSVNPNLPSGVSGVHFRSDLTEIPTTEILHFPEEHGLFEAVLR